MQTNKNEANKLHFATMQQIAYLFDETATDPETLK